jgi:hypothetical protein
MLTSQPTMVVFCVPSKSWVTAGDDVNYTLNKVDLATGVQQGASLKMACTNCTSSTKPTIEVLPGLIDVGVITLGNVW